MCKLDGTVDARSVMFWLTARLVRASRIWDPTAVAEQKMEAPAQILLLIMSYSGYLKETMG